MKIREPIFIVGSGRSGTSLLYRLLAVHPDLCWFSNLTDRYPEVSFLPFVHRFIGVPGIGELLKRRILTAHNSDQFPFLPSEGGTIYHELCHFPHTRKTIRLDSSVRSELFLRIIKTHLAATGKARFLNKQTANTQRLHLMHALFPDAYWIHIIRDARAVARSLFHVSWWPDVALWWKTGATPRHLASEYSDPILLCAEHWRRNVMEIRAASGIFGSRYREIRYEELVQNPRQEIERLVHWAGLSYTQSFAKNIPRAFPNNNALWQKELTVRQRQLLARHIGPTLRRFGYE